MLLIDFSGRMNLVRPLLKPPITIIKAITIKSCDKEFLKKNVPYGKEFFLCPECPFYLVSNVPGLDPGTRTALVDQC